MRARLALRYSQQKVILRETVLKNKPSQMLDISPKGTVPVLQLPDGQVIDESLDIMRWTLQNNDPNTLLPTESAKTTCDELIRKCDTQFKPWLDKYKYADRHPEQSAEVYRQEGEVFLARLESLLLANDMLLSEQPSLVDIAIMPFVRQFAMVDSKWFDTCPYPALRRWLNHWLATEIFQCIMKKYAPWQIDQGDILF
jgi:glutathione S-transferase